MAHRDGSGRVIEDIAAYAQGLRSRNLSGTTYCSQREWDAFNEVIGPKVAENMSHVLYRHCTIKGRTRGGSPFILHNCLLLGPKESDPIADASEFSFYQEGSLNTFRLIERLRNNPRLNAMMQPDTSAVDETKMAEGKVDPNVIANLITENPDVPNTNTGNAPERGRAIRTYSDGDMRGITTLADGRVILWWGEGYSNILVLTADEAGNVKNIESVADSEKHPVVDFLDASAETGRWGEWLVMPHEMRVMYNALRSRTR